MSAAVDERRQAPPAWNDRMLLVYPNGAAVPFDPGGRFFRAGDPVNGCVLDHFELADDGETVVCVLRRT